MRQAAVPAPPEALGGHEAWEDLPEEPTHEHLLARRRPITGGKARGERWHQPPHGPIEVDVEIAERLLPPRPSGPVVSRQPAPDPIAFEVAERYARALTLDPAPPARAQPPTPRRSRAATRDRELDRTRRARPDTPAPASAPARPAPETARSEPAPARRPRPRRRIEATVPPPPLDAPEPEAAPPPRPARPRRVRPRSAPQTGAPRPRTNVHREAQAPPAREVVGGVPGRRTVTIRGRGAERNYGWSAYESRRRPAAPAHERPGFRPDRAAMWAVVLGLLLVLVAVTSAHAAVLVH